MASLKDMGTERAVSMMRAFFFANAGVLNASVSRSKDSTAVIRRVMICERMRMKEVVRVYKDRTCGTPLPPSSTHCTPKATPSRGLQAKALVGRRWDGATLYARALKPSRVRGSRYRPYFHRW